MPRNVNSAVGDFGKRTAILLITFLLARWKENDVTGISTAERSGNLSRAWLINSWVS
jgi:hypothetical protein